MPSRRDVTCDKTIGPHMPMQWAPLPARPARNRLISVAELSTALARHIKKPAANKSMTWLSPMFAFARVQITFSVVNHNNIRHG